MLPWWVACSAMHSFCLCDVRNGSCVSSSRLHVADDFRCVWSGPKRGRVKVCLELMLALQIVSSSLFVAKLHPTIRNFCRFADFEHDGPVRFSKHRCNLV